MSGACASLLVPDLPAAVLDSCRALVSEVSDVVEGENFWIRPPCVTDPALPFLWLEERASDELWQFRPGELDPLQEVFGFVPTASIGFCAMCRGVESDRILAGLADAFMWRQQAILLFGGLLSPTRDLSEWKEFYSQSPSVQASEFRRRLGVFPGRLATVEVDGEPSYHAVDREFLRFWTNHPAFFFVN